MPDGLFLLLQRVLPKRALTEFIGRLASVRGGALTRLAIRAFIARYQVDMGEAADPSPTAYASFNAFFTRGLRPQARPLATAPWICPVDGAVSQCGVIEDGAIVQAKGHHYEVSSLLGGELDLAAQFSGGAFATLYLSPRDYHRIHMPCAGVLRSMTHVPGSLYSVNPVTARGIPGLFARNERVVCVFEGPFGPFVMVLVGATIVGSMATVWHGQVNPPRPGQIRTWHYPQGSVSLAQGEEMGRFLLGSTVVLVVPERVREHWPRAWASGRPVRMGEALAD